MQLDLAPEAQRPGLTTPRLRLRRNGRTAARAGPPGSGGQRMVVNDHPPLVIAPQKTAARTAQRTVRERRNGTRVRRIRRVKDGDGSLRRRLQDVLTRLELRSTL